MNVGLDPCLKWPRSIPKSQRDDFCYIDYVGPYKEQQEELAIGAYSGRIYMEVAIGVCEYFNLRKQYLVDAAEARCRRGEESRSCTYPN